MQADLREAEQLGVNAVPMLIFNQSWVFRGAVLDSILRFIIDNLIEEKEPAAH